MQEKLNNNDIEQLNDNFAQYNEEENSIDLYMKDDGSNYDTLAKKRYEYISFLEKNIVEDLNTNEKKIAVIVRFKLTSQNDYNRYLAAFNSILKNNNNKSENIINELIELFKKISYSPDLKKLHGDIGEAIFIKKCIECGYRDQIIKSLENKNDGNEIIDFQFDNINVEIKNSSKSDKTFYINHEQINKNTIVCVFFVNYYNGSLNEYISIIDIYNMIKQYIGLPGWLQMKYDIYSSSYIELVEKNKIKWQEIDSYFFNYDYFPVVEIKDRKACNKIIYNMNCILDEKQNNFEAKIKEIIK